MWVIKLAVLTSVVLAPVTALAGPRESYLARFYDWMLEHKVHFPSGEEFRNRLTIWAMADDFIKQHNAGNHSYTLGHNQFSHLTPEEFQERMGLGRFALTRPAFGEVRSGELQGALHLGGVRGLASQIDWVEKGAVTPVKNQGACGSCWSFSATGALEGAYYIKYGKAVSFSEEMLVDCDLDGNYGCNGGLMDNAFEWVQRNGGLCTEADYPYTGTQETCKAKNCQTVPGSKVKAWTDVPPKEEALVQALNEGPVSVAIQANQLAFQYYRGGIMDGRCGTRLDHGVLAVGYGMEEGQSWWKVKNSWGPSWGEDGYIRLSRDKAQEGGQCGILLSASYPTLA